MTSSTPKHVRTAVRAAILFAVLVGAVPIARAQFSVAFSGLTTTTAGSSVWFASPLRQRGSNQFLWGKIFRIDRRGASLVAEVAQNTPALPSNNFMLSTPQVTGDGSLLLYVGTLECGEGSSCFLSEHNASTLLNLKTGQQTYVGPNARISRNGRYLASWSSGNVFNPQFTLTDRTTSTTLYQGGFSPTWVSIADDGTTVLVGPSGLQLIQGGMISTLLASGATAASIDDLATTIIYETGNPRRLFVMDLKTMATQQLGPNDRDSFQATMSADGQWVAYLSTIGSSSQVFFSRTDGSDWKQLTARPDGVVEVTLSGDGKKVYAITGDQSILKIDTGSGDITTLVGPTPTITGVTASTPGSLAMLQGTALANASITIAGIAAPILSRSDTSINFQVPWEVPFSADSLSIPEGGAPYFDDATPLDMGPFLPEPIQLGPEEPGTDDVPIAIHADFSSLVTDDNPAAPGEILHLYLMGGGPVSPPVATGVPTPLRPPSTVTTPYSVVVEGTSEPIQVNFFGLAPGMIGVWQMDAVVPQDWSRPYISFQTDFNSPPPNSFWESVGMPPIPVKTGQ